MRTPRINWILAIIFTFISAVVFIAAMVSPAFRAIAYAPVRELILPPPSPVAIQLVYSTEKEPWLKEMLVAFESQHPTIGGHPVKVEMQAMGSREIYLGVLNGSIKPDVISPASSLQIAILEDLSRKKSQQPIVVLGNKENCSSPFKTPLVFVAWRNRAQVLWGDSLPSDFWKKFKDALTDTAGWSSYGHPEWGYIKFGHTDPTKSNSGFMTLVLMSYGFYGKTENLTANDILANQEFQTWLMSIEGAVSEFGESTGPYMKDIVAYGPSKYDIVAVYEASAIEHIENAVGRYGELHVYYPPNTIMSDHPFCILNAEWVTEQKRDAARLFIGFLNSQSSQQIALMKYGFRPTNSAIPLTQPGSPFEKYVSNGLRVDIPGEYVLPSGDVLETLLTFWVRNIQR